MPKTNDVHVSGSRQNGYRVTINGETVETASTQGEAEAVGRLIALLYQSELFIHRAQGASRGQIRERNTFGPDPCPPHG